MGIALSVLFPNQTVISLGSGHDLLAQVDGLLSAQHTNTIPTSARRVLHPSQATGRFYPPGGLELLAAGSPPNPSAPDGRI